MDELKEFATPRQREYIEAIQKHGDISKAARALGVDRSTISRALTSVKSKAAAKGFAPECDMVHRAPEGFNVKGVSTYYNKDGQPTGQWVKSQIDNEKILQYALDAFSESIPRAKLSPSPTHTLKGLMNCYILTDYHLGMKAWHEEAGDDWDMDIAENLILRWFRYAINRSPDAEVGVLAQLGDFLHWDGLEAVTPTSGHLLDADTRFQKMIRIAIRVIRQIIDMLLTKHHKVHVVMAEGNHDLASSAWMREWLYALYEDEPRIVVDRSPDPFYCYEFGNTSLFFHHGHKRKPSDIDAVFASKFRDVFGRTKHSYAHMGHMHHSEVKETSLMVVEQHRTLAASDAYSSRLGWSTGRDAQVITYHKDHGRVGAITVSPEMVTPDPSGK